METIISLIDVSCRFAGRAGQITALDHIDLDIAGGSFVAVMGATGSGKSTLLNCAAALDRPTSGTVRVTGVDVTALKEDDVSRLRRDRIGFVFQSYNLLGELTVAQNVLMPCRLGARQARDLDDVLTAVLLPGTAHRQVGELSGGQRQRVALARALVTAPPVIFADEPTGALDPSTGGEILGLLRRTVDTAGTTVVMVTHDPRAAAYSDRLVMLRDGRISADHPTPGAEAIAEHLRATSAGLTGADR